MGEEYCAEWDVRALANSDRMVASRFTSGGFRNNKFATVAL